jgi:serine/threonine-protein kinase
MEASARPDRTLGYEESAVTAATLLQPVQAGTGFDATALAVEPSRASFSAPLGATRTTVLPRVEGTGGDEVQLHVESKLRYEPLKLLGAGGMGEVVLVEDQDIARRVAVKRLLPELTHPSILARFVDEIRTVGRLEHPNIVPIHDVGIDDLGRYFFVMKYVEGETLEAVIEKLAAGDPAYLARYSYEQRIELFLGVLHALEYAHEHGVVHRDIKPANVMIGRFGEVVLMDWGIAKPLALGRDPAAGAEGAIGAEGEGRARAFATRVGAIIGTPAYMSPEQARGDNASIDVRSDLYSAAVMFHELIGLRHYLFDAPSMEAMIASVIGERQGFLKLLLNHHPNHPTPPGELAHFASRGLEKDPAQRFQSAREMISALQEILQGKVQVQCHITFTKRSVRELGRLVDRSPHLMLLTLLGVAAAVVFALVTLVRGALA